MSQPADLSTLAVFFRNLKATQTNLTLIGPMKLEQKIPDEPVVFVDGGTRHRSNKQSNCFSVGDGDSSNKKLDEILPEDKDYSDLSYVFKQIPQNISQITLLGFLGGRRDHEIINFLEVHKFLKTRTKRCEVCLGKEVVAYSRGRWRLQHDGLFSTVIFERGNMSISGDVSYKCNKLQALSSHGLSNMARGRVLIECNTPCFVFKS